MESSRSGRNWLVLRNSVLAALALQDWSALPLRRGGYFLFGGGIFQKSPRVWRGDMFFLKMLFYDMPAGFVLFAH
jgi:hypothetical protein